MYEVWLCNQQGYRLTLLEESLASFTFASALSRVGSFNLTYGRILNVANDYQLQFWRKRKLIFVGFVEAWDYQLRGGVYTTIISGSDQNTLLNRRIVPFAAGTTNATYTGYNDDAMKFVFSTNYLNGDARDLAHMNLSVADDVSAGTQIVKSFAWNNVFKVLQELAGTEPETYFYIAPVGVANDGRVYFEFQTGVGYLGSDLTNKVVFGPEYGNVSDALLRNDYRTAINYVYAGGQGEGSDRVIVEVEGEVFSPWGYNELFVDARNESDPAGVEAKGLQALYNNRPQTVLEATLVDTIQAKFGKDWVMGDKVTLYAFGEVYDVVVSNLMVKFSNKGETMITKVRVA